jgi:2-polyprenyl-6-methoxyphenol hydroxylase-like FAD-dependent oxidoreductase
VKDEIWATGLYDRDPMPLFSQKHVSKMRKTNETIISSARSGSSNSNTYEVENFDPDVPSQDVLNAEVLEQCLSPAFNDEIHRSIVTDRLMKRDRTEFIKSSHQFDTHNARGSRVTVIGDACHPMSMFKGHVLVHKFL